MPYPTVKKYKTENKELIIYIIMYQKKNGNGQENICINCKRCVNSDEFHCPWSEEGKPVEGWTAAPTKLYTHKYSNGKMDVWQGYHITACPLYIQDSPYMNYMEAAKHIAKELGISLASVYYSWENVTNRYEKKTGKKLPCWVKSFRLDQKLFKDEDKNDNNDDDKGDAKSHDRQ